MAFISGIQIIHAPASALNNAGADTTSSNQNGVAVKSMRIGTKQFPYISAQAYRFWLRNALAQQQEWSISPIFREKKIAYTDANPIKFCDDDLFGYMRAPGKKVEAADSRASMTAATETKETVTRVTPFKTGTFVAMSDGIIRDFGTMSRHEGDPVPHEHQFYRTSLKGLFSLDLTSAGVFSYENRTGFLNLDETRKKLAEENGLENIKKINSYRLPKEERTNRVALLLKAMPLINGGAKANLHYSDVSPVVTVFAVTKGANNPFQYIITGDKEGQAKAVLPALKEIAEVWGDILLSPLYIGWTKGYAEENRLELERSLSEVSNLYPHGIILDHPRRVFEQVAQTLQENPSWLD